MTQLSASSAAPFGGGHGDVRRSPRLRPHGEIDIISAGPSDVQVLSLVNIGPGGFCVTTAAPTPIGLRTHFEFRTQRGLIVTVPACAVYVQPDAERGTQFVSGWEFEHGPDLDEAIGRLVQALADDRGTWPHQ